VHHGRRGRAGVFNGSRGECKMWIEFEREKFTVRKIWHKSSPHNRITLSRAKMRRFFILFSNHRHKNILTCMNCCCCRWRLGLTNGNFYTLIFLAHLNCVHLSLTSSICCCWSLKLNTGWLHYKCHELNYSIFFGLCL
jgi:hypothetical protein